MASLKSIYRRMFHKIIVRPLDAAKVELQFVFNNMAALANGEVGFCASSALMGLGGLEPPTSRLSGAYSNQLSYRPYTTVPTGIVAKSEAKKQHVCMAHFKKIKKK